MTRLTAGNFRVGVPCLLVLWFNDLKRRKGRRLLPNPKSGNKVKSCCVSAYMTRDVTVSVIKFVFQPAKRSFVLNIKKILSLLLKFYKSVNISQLASN